MNSTIIILSGGIGSRFSGKMPKQLFKVGGKTIVEHTIDRAYECGFRKIVLVINKEFESEHIAIKEKYEEDIIVVRGGETRIQSLFNAMAIIEEVTSDEYVYIHDVARPNFSKEVIAKMELILLKEKANIIIPVLNVTDTTRVVKNGRMTEINRDELKSVSTPQCANIKVYKELLKNLADPRDISDDSSLFVKNNLKVHGVMGNKDNIKITTREDLEYFTYLWEKKHENR